MDITGMSMAVSQANLQTDIGVAVLSKTMDTTEVMGQGLISIMDAAAMENSVNPHLGSNLDLRV